MSHPAEEFRKNAYQLVDWMADYMQHVESFPVLPKVEAGEIYAKIQPKAPEEGTSFRTLMQDFDDTILPGMTHWQNPSFFGYFPANSSPASVLAEMLTATLGAQCMSWQTSPAATEMEERMMEWLRDLCGLPTHWKGVIQDTASTSTLVAILTAREQKSGWSINNNGFLDERFTVYCSDQTHSSIEKAVKIAGLGRSSLRIIPTDETFAMDVRAFLSQLTKDYENGFMPLCVIGSLGTTSSTAMDPIEELGAICQEHEIFFHVDAAYAGTAAILPEMRKYFKGLEYADSYVFNPHKWMLTNFDCSAYFVKDSEALLRTFEILPEYLKTVRDPHVNNYRDWGIALGRRFRALKLWFVLRSYGAKKLREILRNQMRIAELFESYIKMHDDFEIMAERTLNLVCFRFKPKGVYGLDAVNSLNERFMASINESGKAFVSHTKLKGAYVIRACFGQTNVEEHHMKAFFDLCKQLARRFRNELD